MRRGSGITNNSGGSGGGSSADGTTEYLAAVVAIGPNTFAHGVSKNIFMITIKNSDNRVQEFSDFRWDATNIYITSPVLLSDITFVITHAG